MKNSNVRGAAKPPASAVEEQKVDLSSLGNASSSVAVVEQGSLTSAADMQSMFAADSEAFGSIDFKGDLAIPFIGILQKSSPQVDEADPKYVQGAKVGMGFNTVTGEIFDMARQQDGKGGLEVILVYYDKKYVEWVPRDNGGGFVGQYEVDDTRIKACTLNDKKRLVTPNNNLMVETAYHYILFRTRSTEPWQWGVFASKSTSLKMTRKWNSMISTLLIKTKDGKSIKPPVFSQIWRLSTFIDSKDSYRWAACDIAHIGTVQDAESYNMAKAFATAVKSGDVRITAPPADDADGHSSADPFDTNPLV